MYNLTLKTLHSDLIEISTKISKIRNISPKQLQIPDLLGKIINVMHLAWYDPKSCRPYAPYLNTISNISSIMIVESPIKKMEIAYNLFTEVLTYEVNEFWNGSKTDKKVEVNIDSDNLKAIIIYVVIKWNLVTMLVDIMLSDSFTSQAIRYTNRAYWMTVVHSAFEFIQNLTDDRIAEIVSGIEENSVSYLLYQELQEDKLDKTISLNFSTSNKDSEAEETKSIDLLRGSFHMKQARIPSNTVCKDNSNLKSKNMLKLSLEFYNSGMRENLIKTHLSSIKSFGKLQSSLFGFNQDKSKLSVNPFSALYLSSNNDDRKWFFYKSSNTNKMISENKKESDNEEDQDQFFKQKREYEQELTQKFDKLFS